jgi:hypothetical protein
VPSLFLPQMRPERLHQRRQRMQQRILDQLPTRLLEPAAPPAVITPPPSPLFKLERTHRNRIALRFSADS